MTIFVDVTGLLLFNRIRAFLRGPAKTGSAAFDLRADLAAGGSKLRVFFDLRQRRSWTVRDLPAAGRKRVYALGL